MQEHQLLAIIPANIDPDDVHNFVDIVENIMNKTINYATRDTESPLLPAKGTLSNEQNMIHKDYLATHTEDRKYICQIRNYLDSILF